MRDYACATALGGALLLAACQHVSAPTESRPSANARESVEVRAVVTIAEDGAGDYSYSYEAPFFDERGNFDFSKNGAAFNTIRLTFTIGPTSVAGIRFKPDAPEAMWIVEKMNVDKTTGSPAGRYRGTQFYDFAVSEDGSELSVTDQNDDGVLYRYGLRFDLGGKTVIDDPDGQNGGYR